MIWNLSSIEKKTYKNDQLRANLCVKCRIISQFVPIVKVAFDSKCIKRNASARVTHVSGFSNPLQKKAETNNKQKMQSNLIAISWMLTFCFPFLHLRKENFDICNFERNFQIDSRVKVTHVIVRYNAVTKWKTCSREIAAPRASRQRESMDAWVCADFANTVSSTGQRRVRWRY